MTQPKYRFPSGTNTMGWPEHDTKKHGPGTAWPGGSAVPGPQLFSLQCRHRTRHG